MLPAMPEYEKLMPLDADSKDRPSENPEVD